MSSETSTKTAGVDPAPGTKDAGLQSWQFFVLAALGCSTAAVFMSRGQGMTAAILVTAMIGGAAFVGLMALRTIRPLVTEPDDRTAMIGHRTRAALEREKLLALRAIKELEFDRAMGKLSDEDFAEMGGRLRTRAARLIRQLDAGAGYREQIEKDLAKKLDSVKDTKETKGTKTKTAERACAACSTSNDEDAKFCKRCGAKL
jgi:hypothetical protein